MKVAFLTLWDGDEFGRMEAMASPNKRRYCSKHGFDYIVFDRTLDAKRPAPWSKIKAVAKVLDGYEWVIWHDTDAIIWNDLVDVRHYLQISGADFVAQELHDGINTGVFCIRRCKWSKSFLAEIYDQTDSVNHPFYEQDAVSRLVGCSPWKERCCMLPHAGQQHGLHGYYTQSEWDKLFVHFAGLCNDKRTTLVENVSRLAGYEQHLRVLRSDDFPVLLTRLGLLGEGAEIGAGRGSYASLLLNRWEGKRLHLIDPWTSNQSGSEAVAQGLGQEGAYRECVRRISHCESRVTLHKTTSREAVPRFRDESLDFVRLDANPAYESVSQDIESWWPKVRPGGMLFGSNFLDGELAEGEFGVRSAVQEFEKREQVAAAATAEWSWPSWYVIKRPQSVPAAWHSGHPTMELLHAATPLKAES